MRYLRWYQPSSPNGSDVRHSPFARLTGPYDAGTFVTMLSPPSRRIGAATPSTSVPFVPRLSSSSRDEPTWKNLQDGTTDT